MAGRPALAAVALATTVRLEAQVAEYLLKHRLPHIFDHLVQEVALLRPENARKGLVDALVNLDYGIAFPHRLSRPDPRPFHTMDSYVYDHLVNNPHSKLRDRDAYFDLYQVRGLVFHLMHALAETRPDDPIEFCKQKLLDPEFAPEIVTPDLEAEAREKAAVAKAEADAAAAEAAAAAEEARANSAEAVRRAAFAPPAVPKPVFGELNTLAYAEPGVPDPDDDGYAVGEEVGVDAEEALAEWEEGRDGLARPPRPLLDPSAAAIVASLPFFAADATTCMLDYVWLSSGDPASAMRCRTLTFDRMPRAEDGSPALVDAEEDWKRLPMLEFKAKPSKMESNELTGMLDDDVFARPQVIFRDPFRGDASSYAIFCDTILPPPTAGLLVQKHQLLNGDLVDYIPHGTNRRWRCQEVVASVEGGDPGATLTISQAYGLVDPDTGAPLGWSGTVPHPESGAPATAGPYFAGTGTGATIGRDLADAHLAACLRAGVRVSDLAAGDLPGTWTFTVGPCGAVELGDHVLMARYVLQRVCERFGVSHTLGPELGAGGATFAPRATLTFEAPAMRTELGYKTMLKWLESVRRKSPGRKLTWAASNANARLASELGVPAAAVAWLDWWEANEGVALAVDPPTHPWLPEYGIITDYRASVAEDPYDVVARLFSEMTDAQGKPQGIGYNRESLTIPQKMQVLRHQH